VRPKKTWVIGGTSGIGAAAASVLLAKVAPNAVFVTGEEVDVRAPRQLREYATAKGPFDGLIYSAGISKLDWTENIYSVDMQNMFEVNVTGLVNALQACPSARRVVVVGSDAAWRPMRTSLAYCASKAALHAAVACIARERASDEFSINIVAPGMTDDTGMQKYIDEIVPIIRNWPEGKAREYERSQIPMGRRAKPWEVGEVIANVMCMETNYLNGAVIPVNGGR
jgi:NAD(P)-dependent dehydrogenase (short-subunit alcohol dehydrogenase family)